MKLAETYGKHMDYPPLSLTCVLFCVPYLRHTNANWYITSHEHVSMLRIHMPMWFLFSFVRCFFFSFVCSYSFGIYQGSQTLENNKSPRPNGLGLSSAFSCLNLSKTLPLVFKILLHILTFDRDLCGFFSLNFDSSKFQRLTSDGLSP